MSTTRRFTKSASIKFYPIIKPWPFRGWDIDLIGKIYPMSLKGHHFIIVAIDLFTKGMQVKPMKKVEQANIVEFIKEYIIYRFGSLFSFIINKA